MPNVAFIVNSPIFESKSNYGFMILFIHMDSGMKKSFKSYNYLHIQAHRHTHTLTRTHAHTRTYIYIYMFLSLPCQNFFVTCVQTGTF